MPTTVVFIGNALLIASICYLCYRRYRHGSLARHFWTALLLKIIFGLLLGILFTEFYEGGDTITYYRIADRISQLDASQFIAEITKPTVSSQAVRAIYFVRLVAVIKWITGANYWIMSVYFSLFSFLGSIYLVDKLANWKKELLLPAVIAFLYFPSVVFWSSGLLKESLVFGALNFMLGAYISWYSHKRFHVGNFLLSALAFLIIVSFKYYIGAVLMPILLYLTIYRHPFWERKQLTNPWIKNALLTLILAIPVTLFLSWLSPNLDYSELWRVMKTNHDKYLELAPDGALYTLNWFGGGADLIINIPYLLFSGTFRPMLWEDLTFPAICAGLENAVILAGCIYAIYLFVGNQRRWSAEMLALIVYVSVLAVFLGYAAPNFGTLARFKIYYMPFVLLLISYPISNSKLFGKN